MHLGWFPAIDGYDYLNSTIGWNWTFITDAIYHGVLPAATIVIASLAGWIIGMRNMMVTVQDEDYVLLAEAAGLPRRRVVWYAARNAVLPQVSSFAMALSFVVAGSVLTEIVFSYPGIGFTLLGRGEEPGLHVGAGHLPGHHHGRPGRQFPRRHALRRSSIRASDRRPEPWYIIDVPLEETIDPVRRPAGKRPPATRSGSPAPRR